MRPKNNVKEAKNGRLYKDKEILHTVTAFVTHEHSASHKKFEHRFELEQGQGSQHMQDTR
jgi:hypothetical protein